MKIAIIARSFTKRDMDINACQNIFHKDISFYEKMYILKYYQKNTFFINNK